MPLPNFFLVGAAKSGTTTLYDALSQHPEIFMSNVKEPCFFSEGWPNWISNFEKYEALFQGSERFVAIGEASTTYLDDPLTPTRIQQMIPERIKILISLRNPVDRAYSQWEHTRYHENYEKLSFTDALTAENKRAANLDELKKLSYYRPGIFMYYHQGEYAEKVKRYINAFGRENVHVIIFEALQSDPQRTLSSVYSFLNVKADFVPQIEVKNASRQSRFQLLSNILQSPPSALQQVYDHLPISVQKATFKVFRSIYWANQMQRKKESINPELRQKLLCDYLPGIHDLEALLEIDLSHWYTEKISV